MILSLSWLKAYNPIIDWCNHLITFTSKSSREVLAVKVLSNVATAEWLKSVSSAQCSIRVGSSSKANGQVPISMKEIMHSAAESSTPVPLKTTTNPLPSNYEDFQDVFEKKEYRLFARTLTL
jgi:hypothetical protein